MNGRAWDDYESVLARFPFFPEYREGRLTKGEFREAMEKNKDGLLGAGLAEHAYRRLFACVSGNREVEGMLEAFREAGGVGSADYGRDAFEAFSARLKPSYDNGGFITEIHPEDELIMYAAAKLTGARSMFVAGAYFGYWAVWAMPTVKGNGGVCVLSDVNPKVMEVAERNFRRLEYGGSAEFRAEDAEAVLKGGEGTIDLLALDAQGLYNDPRPTHRGKAIYAPFLEAALPRLKKGSCVIVHNMDRGSADMAPFVRLIASVAAAKAELTTFNGLGLYRV